MANIDRPATLQELSVEYAKKQPHQIDWLLEETPVLAGIKFEAASHPLWNTAEVKTEINGAGFVKMNSPLPKMSSASKLEQVDLNIMGGEIFVQQDKAVAFGGLAKYLAKQMPSFLADAGVKTEKHIIYENYRQYALDNGNAQTAGGSAALSGDSGLYSIVIVRQVPGENCGLYSPEGFKQGAMLDVQPLYGGNLSHDENGVPGYWTQVKGYFGMQLMNPRTVSTIVTIDSSHLPSIAQIDEALLQVRAKPGNTRMLMHPRVLNWLGEEYKKNMIRMTNGENGLNFLIGSWNGIPMVSSYNFLEGTEAAETLA